MNPTVGDLAGNARKIITWIRQAEKQKADLIVFPEVADLVSSYSEVNHNYEREHAFNLWFVVTASDERAVSEVLAEVQRRSGLAVMDLPLTEEFHIDLGFRLWQS